MTEQIALLSYLAKVVALGPIVGILIETEIHKHYEKVRADISAKYNEREESDPQFG